MTKVALLLGAGASLPSGVPLGADMVKRYRAGHPPADELAVLDRLSGALGALGHAGPNGGEPDIETLLAAIVHLLRGEVLVRRAFDSQYGPFSAPEQEAIARMEVGLRSVLRECCFVERDSTAYLNALPPLIRADSPFWIFALNYDVCIEQFWTRVGLQFTDGCDPLFAADRLRSGGEPVRLVKLHGSITWFSDGVEVRSMPVFFSGPGAQPRAMSGVPLEVAMLVPGEKEREETVFRSLRQLLAEQLATAEWLVIAGCSLRDEPINQILREAIQTNPRLKYLVVGPSAEKRAHDAFAGKLGGVSHTDPAEGPGFRIVTVPVRWEQFLPLLAQDGVIGFLDSGFKDAVQTRISPGGKIANAALNFLRAGAFRQAGMIPEEVIAASLDPPKYVQYLGLRAVALTAYSGDRTAAAAARAELRAALVGSLREGLGITWGVRRERFGLTSTVRGGLGGVANALAEVEEARVRAEKALAGSPRAAEFDQAIADTRWYVTYFLNLSNDQVGMYEFPGLNDGPGPEKGADRLGRIMEKRLGHAPPFDAEGADMVEASDVLGVINERLDAQAAANEVVSQSPPRVPSPPAAPLPAGPPA